MSFLSLWIGKRFPPFQFVEMQCALEKITLKVGWAPSIQIGDQSIVPLFHFTSFCLQCRRLECNPWIGKIPWRREWLPLPVLLPGESRGQRSLAGYSPWGRKRVQHNWATNTFTFHFHALEKEMATLSSILAWRIPGTGEPSGLPSLGSHRVGHDWSDLAVAAAACS